MRPLRICLVASEVSPFAKTGGLADVMSGLGRYLGEEGHDVRIFIPFYRSVRESGVEVKPLAGAQNILVHVAWRTIRFSIVTAPLPDSDVLVHFIDCPDLYERDWFYTQDGDEALRFAMLSLAVIETCQRLQWPPDVMHCNDWHAGLLPLYLRSVYHWDRMFDRTRTLFSMHNVGFQGFFPHHQIGEVGLANERGLLHHGDLHNGVFSFFRTAVLHADKLSTVSRTYAQEIQTPEFGHGADDLLRWRSGDLLGIVNGVDYGDWDPDGDPLIPHHFSAARPAGKAKMKAALLERMGLDHDPRAPVFGVVSRLTNQKGFDLFAEAIPIFLQREDMRLCVLGSGDPGLEQFFLWLRNTWPDKVAIHLGYDNELAHWIEAGSDVFLMPSRFEPCGLNQMYSLRYGTPPIVRQTGGLADTVEPWDPGARTGTGFLLGEYSSYALARTIDWVLRNWRDKKGWKKLMKNGMTRDFSWQRQGLEYVNLYRMLCGL